MPRAIDFHVHLPMTEFMQVTLGPPTHRQPNAIFALRSNSKITSAF